MSLEAIAEKGITPLFLHWVKRIGGQGGALDQSDWAKDEVLVDYIATELGLQLGEAKDYSMKFMHNPGDLLNLLALRGLHAITFNLFSTKTVIMDFQKEKVTVVSIWKSAQIRCQTLERADWLSNLITTYTRLHREDYGKLILLTTKEAREIPAEFSYADLLSISPFI